VNSTADTATLHTADFVSKYLRSGSRVIEVGAGDGRLAAELRVRGYGITAVEADATSASEARRRNVPIVIANWPQFETRVRFDGVLFTRSLHHIPQLGAALDAARRDLEPGGVLLVEDFAYERADEKTIGWLSARLDEARRRGRFHEDREVTRAAGSVASWHASHDHDLHEAATMQREIESRFTLRARIDVPYLYRYLGRCTEDQTWLRQRLRSEETAGRRGEIVLIGRRYVAA